MHIQDPTTMALLAHGIAAIAGGFVHALEAHRNGSSKTWKDHVSLVIMSSFTGVIFALVALSIWPSSIYLTIATAGTGGYIGVEGLSWIIKYARNKWLK
jgi:LydA holin phage, holin superfamily III